MAVPAFRRPPCTLGSYGARSQLLGAIPVTFAVLDSARVPRSDVPGLRSLSLAVVLGAVGLGPLVIRQPVVAGVLVLTAVLTVAAFVHRPVAGYVVVGVVPLMAGMHRGSALPFLRPSEALLLLVGGALLTRRLLAGVTDRPPALRMTTTHASILFLVAAGSVVPLLWLLARRRPFTEDDVLYGVQVAKFALVYLIVRASIRSDDEVRRCCLIAMAAGAAVALIGILQALNLLGVPSLLAAHFKPTDEAALDANRASSTLGHSFAMADLLVFNLGLAGAWLARNRGSKTVLLAATALFAIGSLASGKFSAALGLLAGIIALGFVTGRLKRAALALLPLVVLAPVVLRPVIAARLQGFQSPEGLPDSWLGRLHNLETFVWPRLFSGFNWVLGVRPSAKVAEGTQPSSPFHYIESGYTWLLWVGGVPLLFAFLVFVAVNMRATIRIARARSDATGDAAVAAYVALVVLAVLTWFDPHMTLRGSGDLLFALLALAYAATGRRKEAQGPPSAEVPRGELLDRARTGL